jgi:type III restriction enzyme
VQTDVEYDCVYVDEESFGKYRPTSFRQLLEGFKEYKGVPDANATGGTR